MRNELTGVTPVKTTKIEGGFEVAVLDEEGRPVSIDRLAVEKVTGRSTNDGSPTAAVRVTLIG